MKGAAAAAPRARGRAALTRAGIGALIALYAATLVFLRGRPSVNGDGGIFLSVAAALNHGYRLYDGVWDNKPPLFYYAGALGYGLLGWRGVYLLDIAWLTLAGTGMALWLGRLEVRRLAVIAAVAAYPLFLTGVWYYAGYSELPGMAVIPLVAWLWARGSTIGAGVVLGAMAFARPDYAPLFLAVLVVPVAAGELGGATLGRAAARGAAGLVGGLVATGGVVVVRGELGGYVRTLRQDVGYPSRVLSSRGDPPSVIGHLKVVGGFLFDDLTRGLCLAVGGAALVAVAWTVLRRPSHGGTPIGSGPRRLAAALALTAAGVLVIIALGGLWRHGLEILALPAALAAALISELAAGRLRSRLAVAGVAVAAIAVFGLAGGGIGTSTQTVGGSPESGGRLSDWWRPIHSTTATALNVASGGRPTTYARIGTNNDDGHLAFIDPGLRLVCPVFAQYPFDDSWSDVVGCLQRMRPDLVVVSPGFVAQVVAPGAGAGSSVAAGSRAGMHAIMATLAAGYTPVLSRRGPGGGVVVWRRSGTPRS